MYEDESRITQFGVGNLVGGHSVGCLPRLKAHKEHLERQLQKTNETIALLEKNSEIEQLLDNMRELGI